MNPRRSLQIFLLMAFAFCLALVLVFQLMARAFIELPALSAQEYAGDVHAVEQVRRAFALNLAHLRAVTEDNAHWINAYRFMKAEQGSDAYLRFARSEYGHVDSMHVVPRVNGYTYFKPNGEVFFESTYDFDADSPGLSVPLALEPLLELLSSTDYGAVAGGFINSPVGPLQVVITGINDDAAALKPNGFLVIWRKFDARFLGEFVEPLGADIQLAPIANRNPLPRALLDDPTTVMPRDAQGNTRWVIEDIFGQPLLGVTQAARPRVFNDGLLSTSSVVGFSTSALLLALLSLFVARSVIKPIVDTSAFIEAVTTSQDFSRRLPANRGDEVGTVARRFNQLLERVESQEVSLREQNAQLEEMADRDSLTGAHNRRVFDRTLERDWALAMRSGNSLTCIMFDVDCFKDYNDHYGHPAGDAVLRLVSGLLQGHTQRTGDCFCRYGGEEFVALLSGIDAAAALTMAKRMVAGIEALAIAHASSRVAPVLTLSAGVATIIPVKSMAPDTLVKLADRALYDAKQRGRNQVVGDAV